MTLRPDWWSADGVANAYALRSKFASAFSAFGEVDALGHRLLTRLISSGPQSRLDFLVGAMLLRRSVMQFVGVRHLLSNSAVDPSKPIVRALFETLLNTRYLVHGGRRNFDLYTPSSSGKREIRARYFIVGGLRNEVYQRQALLDRVWSRVPVPKDTRRQFKQEVDSRVALLLSAYPVQQRRYGPFAFHRKKGKKKFYHDELKWYSFGFPKTKPRNILQLAKRFGWLDLYWMIYKPFSEANHPLGLFQDLEVDDSEVGVLLPYAVDDFGSVGYWAGHLQLLLLNYIAKAFHPESLDDIQRIHKRIESQTNDLNPSLVRGMT